jgi:hypothetical protein
VTATVFLGDVDWEPASHQGTLALPDVGDLIVNDEGAFVAACWIGDSTATRDRCCR